jgi:hypothetical protein
VFSRPSAHSFAVGQRQKSVFAHNSTNTVPIAEIQTFLESAYQGEGPIICVKLFPLNLTKNMGFFHVFLGVGLG